MRICSWNSSASTQTSRWHVLFSRQKLLHQTSQLRPEVDEIAEFVEERFLDDDSEKTVKAKNEVDDLQQRWESLNDELNSRKVDLETTQREQAKFHEQCRHLNAVLQDTEEKMSLGRSNVDQLHEQVQCFEVMKAVTGRV